MENPESVKGQEKEIVEELEHEVEDLEEEFGQVNDDNVSDSVKRKQQQVENILSEVHQQLDSLRQISEKLPDEGFPSEDDRKE